MSKCLGPMQAWQRPIVLVIYFLVAPFLGLGVAHGQSAFIVSNSKYVNATALPTAAIDGRSMEHFLADIGYERANIFHLSDFTSEGRSFRVEWYKYLDRLKSGVSVFYFSGHGATVDGESIIIPVDIAQGASDAELLQQGISVSSILRDFVQQQSRAAAAGNKLHGIFFFDASRSGVHSPIRTKGFLPKSVAATLPDGLFVMYSASPGQVSHTSLDVDSIAKPSVFTRFVIEHFGDLSISLSAAAKRVRWSVYQAVATAARAPQTPEYFDSLAEGINLLGRRIALLDRADKALFPQTPSEVQIGKHFWECPACPRLVVIPTGSVLIGSPPNESGRLQNERFEGGGGSGRLTAKIERPLAVGLTEITVDQFRSFLMQQDGNCLEHPACKAVNGSLPVSGVSWKEAVSYADFLNKQLGRPGKYRLPTEAEWEYFARAGSEAAYVYGNDVDRLCQFGNGADASLKSFIGTNWNCSDGVGRTVAPVGSFLPNSFGIYDVHGNVAEWVSDCWVDHHTVAKKLGGVENEYADCERVLRGGSWLSSPYSLRLAARRPMKPYARHNTVGFRLVRELGDIRIVTGK